MDCIFACESEQDARVYRDGFRGGSALYEIEVPDQTKTHRGDYALITTSRPGVTFLDSYVEGAIAYWSEEPRGMVECLVGGSAKITRLID